MKENKESPLRHFKERGVKAELPFEEWLNRLKKANDRDTILSCLHSGLRYLRLKGEEEVTQCFLVYLFLARDWRHALPDSSRIPFTEEERNERAVEECTTKAFTELARALSAHRACSSRELFEGVLHFFSCGEHVPQEPRFYQGVFREAASSLRHTFFEFARKVWSFGADERPAFLDVRDLEERGEFRARCRRARPAILRVWLESEGENQFWLNRLADCNGTVQKMLWKKLEQDWKCRHLADKDLTQESPALALRLLSDTSMSFGGAGRAGMAAILVLAPLVRREKAKVLWQKRAEVRKKAAEDSARARERAMLEAQKAELEAQLAALKNR